MQKKVLMDLSMAAGGLAGIPHDTRITYALLTRLDGIQTSGLLLDHHNNTIGFKPLNSAQSDIFSSSEYLLKLLNASSDLGIVDTVMRYIRRFRLLGLPWNATLTLMGLRGRTFELTPEVFSDYIWAEFFRPSVDSVHARNILGSNFYGSDLTFTQLYASAMGMRPCPRLHLKDVDFFITQRYFPGKLRGGARLIVRYHDSIPITHPHTIKDPLISSRIHSSSITQNARGAFFVCNSETTRDSLLKLFPKLKERVAVIHCCVPNYLAQGEARPVKNIVSTRAVSVSSDSSSGEPSIPKDIDEYFLCVGTIEPRKNYPLIFEAWNRFLDERPHCKLIVVGGVGWGAGQEMTELSRLQQTGSVILLRDVQPSEMRSLYSGATAVISASVSEGFSYSGVEAMQTGTPVLASDIPCHREIYGDVPMFFSPYSASDLFQAMVKVQSLSDGSRSELMEAGVSRATIYSEDRVARAWGALITSL